MSKSSTTRVQVYRNLTRGGWSIRTRVDGKWRVTGYAESVCLTDATFKVLESGRVRSVSKQREVHAWIEGELSESVSQTARQIRYNPFLFSTFVFADTSEAVYSVQAVCLTADNKVFQGEIN